MKNTLETVLSLISAIDDISIQDGNGVVRYNGICCDFRATTEAEEKRELLNTEVSRIRAYKDVIVILLA